MYQYDQYDQTIINERVERFREQMQRYLAGELTDEEFLPLRLMNGLYIQRHAPMLRVAVPYGLLSSKQVRMIAHIARKYDKGYAHVSTRQNFQFNWPKLETVPDILADLASVEMHAVQTSGNCIRNITTDQFAGVAADEVEDPRPWCEIMRQWSTFHPEFSYLPRKFKIAVCGSEHDRAATTVHDIGLYVAKNDAGEMGWRVTVGGGLGRLPHVGKEIREWLPKNEILAYIEAIVRVYNQQGRRDNKHKARIKILVNALGVPEFTRLVEEEYSHLANGPLQVTDDEIARVSQHFTPFSYANDVAEAAFDEQQQSDPAFGRWVTMNTVAHKQAGYRSVWIALKGHGRPPGDITDQQLEAVAELADEYSFGQIRNTHNQNMVLADVRVDQLQALWHKLREQKLAMPVIGTLIDMICCPGLDFCALANAGSINIAEQIEAKFDDIDYLYDIGDIEVKMSGCMNACGHHHVGHIGILGVDKRGEEWYQLTLGGCAANDAFDDAKVGDRLGKAIAKDDVASAIDRILKVYVAERQGEERFIDTYRRIGIAPFKASVYDQAA